VYQAITAAGFGHLSESQLFRTPYRSVHEGQEAQFDQVKARYRSQPPEDPVVLTQICLLLSLWSPGSISEGPRYLKHQYCCSDGVQNNSYWLNLAFKHATAGELWRAQPDNVGQPCRRKLLWWCCLVRDRVLALGMRRPYRLHRAPFEETLISQVDFGLERKYPSYTDFQSKQISMLAFIWLCKLSEIMAAIAVFQRRTRFSRDWNGESIQTSVEELLDVVKLEQELRKWKEEFEAAAVDVVKDHDYPDTLVPMNILTIVLNCLIAVLYQPYLHLSWLDYTCPVDCIVDPLQKMKEGSQAVESSIINLMTNKQGDTLPNWL